MEDVKDLMTHPEGTLAAVEAELADRDAEIENICRWAAARAGVLVIAPKLSTTALIANDAYMVSRIAAVYGHTATAGAIIGFLGGLGGSVVSALLTSVFPNPKVKIPLAICLTYAVGKCAKIWVESGMPMPGDFSEYRERLMEIVEHNKTTIAALVDSPLKNKPLGDENKDFLAEAGVGSDEFLGLNSFNFGSLLNGDLLESFGSIKNVVLGVASAAVAGIAGKALANSDNEYIANAKHALSGIGALLATVEGVSLEFLNFITFIGIIAGLVQLLEMTLDKFFPALYNALGIFLPLIAVNCAIFGGVSFAVQREYTFAESAVYGVGAGLGWMLAIVALAGLTEKMKYADVPAGLKGLGITFITAGLMALGFMSFSGIQL